MTEFGTSWSSTAPSNIALIKYMGKRAGNIPCNVSLSYTLDRFVTEVSLEHRGEKDEFVNELALPPFAVDRFLRHLKNIKTRLGYEGFFRVKSRNNFPHSAGIASSSSAFAALTECTLTAICEIKGMPLPSADEMSRISREASGGSCRSFFSPWALWRGEGGEAADLNADKLGHDLVLTDARPKKISSGEAHEAVKSSPLFRGRPERAEKRFTDLIDAFNARRWGDARKICAEEYRDMHSLFETSAVPFSYIGPPTRKILAEIEDFCGTAEYAPIVTLDAGPNIHLLWKNDSQDLRKRLKSAILCKNPTVGFL
jgi:diphosphomevalonate decarboxylase